MRILEENEINYSIEDILDAINDELGFSAIKIKDKEYIIKITNSYNLFINFNNEIKIELRIKNIPIDMSESTSEVETLVTAGESSIEIVNLINRMTGEGGMSNDYS